MLNYTSWKHYQNKKEKLTSITYQLKLSHTYLRLVPSTKNYNMNQILDLVNDDFYC